MTSLFKCSQITTSPSYMHALQDDPGLNDVNQDGRHVEAYLRA